MKKIILFLCSCFLFIPNVFAQRLSPFTTAGFFYQLEDNNKTYKKPLARLIDYPSKQPFYDVTPTRIWQRDHEYFEAENPFSISFLSDVSKLIYYGYKYSEGDNLHDYHATQYLIFSLFEDYNLKIFQDSVMSGYYYVRKEIEKIKERLKEATFPLADFDLETKEFSITNPYVLKHFTVSGEFLSVSTTEEEIKITFLEDKESYTIHFEPKISCYDVTKYLDGKGSIGALGATDICEKEYNILAKNKNFQKKEPISKVEPVKVQNENKSEEKKSISYQEVQVPNTKKNSFLWLYLLLGMVGLAFIKK